MKNLKVVKTVQEDRIFEEFSEFSPVADRVTPERGKVLYVELGDDFGRCFCCAARQLSVSLDEETGGWWVIEKTQQSTQDSEGNWGFRELSCGNKVPYSFETEKEAWEELEYIAESFLTKEAMADAGAFEIVERSWYQW